MADEESREAAGPWFVGRDSSLGSGQVPWPTAEDFLPAHYRIEALRAASRIVAASNPNKMEEPVATTIWAAEKIARWLETGER